MTKVGRLTVWAIVALLAIIVIYFTVLSHPGAPAHQ
jgi:hypothetical protein